MGVAAGTSGDAGPTPVSDGGSSDAQVDTGPGPGPGPGDDDDVSPEPDAGPPEAGVDSGPPVFTATKENIGAGFNGLRVIAFANDEILVGKMGISKRISFTPSVVVKDLPDIDDSRGLAFASDTNTISFQRPNQCGRKANGAGGVAQAAVTGVQEGQDIVYAGGRSFASFKDHVESWKFVPDITDNVFHSTDNQGEPRGAATDGNFVYWADHKKNAIFKAGNHAAGGPLFSDGVLEPTSVAVDGSDLVFTTKDSIFRGPIAGGVPTKLAKDLGHPVSLAVDEAYVYWAEADTGSFRRMAKTGGPIATFSTGTKFDTTFNRIILVNGQFVFWAQPADGAVFRIAK